MKKLLLILLVLFGVTLYAQSPRKMAKNAPYSVTIKEGVHGDVAKLFADAGYPVNCECIVKEGHSLFSYRLGLDQSVDETEAQSICDSMTEPSSGLVRTFTVTNDYPIEQLRGLKFIENIYVQEVSRIYSDKPEPLEDLQWSDDWLKLREAYQYARQQGYVPQGTIGAVVDTGLNPDNHDLQTVIEYLDFTGEGLYDLHGHGSHVGGIYSGELNGKGMFASYGKTLVIDAKAMGKGGGGFSNQISEAVINAVDKGAKIIVMSLGPWSEPFSTDAINYAYENGVIIVIAAGNSGRQLIHPAGAANPKVIAVGALTKDGKRAGFSNWEDFVFYGPGVRIYGPQKNGVSTYTTKNGTSQACPNIAKVIHFMYDFGLWRGYTLTLEEIKEILKLSGTSVLDRGESYTPNAYNAILELDKYLQPKPPVLSAELDLETGLSYLNYDGRKIESAEALQWYYVLKANKGELVNNRLIIGDELAKELESLLNEVETNNNNPRLRTRLKELFGRGKFMMLLADGLQEELDNNPDMRERRRKRLERTIRILRRGAMWLGTDGVAELSQDEQTQLQYYKNILL